MNLNLMIWAVTKILVRGPATGDRDEPPQHVGPTNAGGAFRRFFELWRPRLAEAEGDLSLATVRAWFCPGNPWQKLPREVRRSQTAFALSTAWAQIQRHLAARFCYMEADAARREGPIRTASSERLISGLGTESKGSPYPLAQDVSAQILNSECWLAGSSFFTYSTGAETAVLTGSSLIKVILVVPVVSNLLYWPGFPQGGPWSSDSW